MTICLALFRVVSVLFLEYNIPCAKAVLLKVVIFYPLMETFIDELPKKFNIFRSSGRQNKFLMKFTTRAQ